MKNHNFFTKLFDRIYSKSTSGNAKISYSSEGRYGHVLYRSPDAEFVLYYEFGGGDCIAIVEIPSPENWEKVTRLPLHRRDEILQYLGQQIVKDQTIGGKGTFKIEGNWLNIYS